MSITDRTVAHIKVDRHIRGRQIAKRFASHGFSRTILAKMVPPWTPSQYLDEAEEIMDDATLI